eukprot:gi/632986961/ref/XP_007910532.1/ PREDICTED: uncharacterized protein LOC103191342 [Callorhinchus milii]
MAKDGIRKAGWAVTTLSSVEGSGCHPAGTSAQQAELRALTEACNLAEGKTVNIYTDSRYAFGVAHDFGSIWRCRGYLTVTGTPIRNGKEVQTLLEAMSKPSKAAIPKCKAPTKENADEAKGNAKADEAAKRAAERTPQTNEDGCRIRSSETKSLHAEIAKMQAECSKEEIWTWMEEGMHLGSDRIWRQRDTQRTVAPQSLMAFLAQQIHSWEHLAPQQMVARFARHWWGKGFKKHAQNVADRCVPCQKINPGPITVMPQFRPSAAMGPFQEIQVDYISLPKSQGFSDVLVIVDRFSKWVQATLVRKAPVTQTAKILCKDYIPRCGLPKFNRPS